MKRERMLYSAAASALALLAAGLWLSLAGRYALAVSGRVTPCGAEEAVIVIDAGHGDFDPGAIGADGTKEKDINLAIANELYALFSASGYPVVRTREGERTLAGEDCTSIASKKRSDTRARVALADSFASSVLLSVHQNAFADRSQHGAQMFFGTKHPESELLCECISAGVVRLLQPENTRQVKKGTDSVYLLVHTNAPTALIECGFLTNAAELALLKDPVYQKQMAFAIFIGYCNYLEARAAQ